MKSMKIVAYQPNQAGPFILPSTPAEQIDAYILTYIAYRGYGTSDQLLTEQLGPSKNRRKYPGVDYFDRRYFEKEPNPDYVDVRAIVEAGRERLQKAKLLKVADYKPHTGDLTRKLYVLTEQGSMRANDIYGGKVLTEALTPEQIAAATPKKRKPAVRKKAAARKTVRKVKRVVRKKVA